ncbi:MAG: cobalamin-dependent protein [Desulfobia sp.]
MRVLMISANTEQVNMPVLPIGMARVAAAVEAAGHDIRVVNLMRPEHVIRELPGTISGFAPEVIGISVRNIDNQDRQDPKFLLPPVKAVIEECRRLSAAPVVLGGPGYSIFPRAVLAYLSADYGIQGEGEKDFPELLDRIAAKASVEDIPGLVMPGEGMRRPPHRIRQLDDYPLPRPGLHLVVPEDVDTEQLWVPFQTRRGCPMNCSYCSTPAIEGSVMRHQSLKASVKNLETYVAAGYKRFFFVDNLFNVPSGYAESLCDALITADADIAWQAIIYPERLDNQLVGKMARAGCTGVALGFESGSKQILSALNKKFGPIDIRNVSELFRRSGISRRGFLLLGGPGETRDTVEESLAFAEYLDLESVKLTAGIRIYPHTLLAGQAIEKGLVEAGDDLLYPKFYMEPGLEDWLPEKVMQLAEQRPDWYI